MKVSRAIKVKKPMVRIRGSIKGIEWAKLAGAIKPNVLHGGDIGLNFENMNV